ncbi:MAG: glycoside hydrolase family 99-like domain-containing protein [Duncaniella sp.]|nr:glycoside hydrolase family 99-like domain-containing protein [Duncaniella sp.]
MKFRTIAIHLPQFHPFKENDEWWGKGFTEWTNVAKARPRFIGHYQPHIPADLGFYDLRLPETREQQAQMAKDAGIYGFCYYHYWFNGHQLMERPLEEILKSGKPDYPFMLCWANENWTRAWDGGEKQILIKQDYSEEDDRNHIRFLIKNYFKDSRYICVDGKPVFCVYRYDLFPDIRKTISIWREEAALEGLELYLCMFESFKNTGMDGLQLGFDAAIEFQPHAMNQNGYNQRFVHIIRRGINRIFRPILHGNLIPNMYSYKSYVNYVCKLLMPKYKRFPCITPGWDNTSRKKNNYMLFVKSTPEKYRTWLKHILDTFKPYSKDENFIFINAWNEWAEGNHLEPDKKWGDSYLKETRSLLK